MSLNDSECWSLLEEAKKQFHVDCTNNGAGCCYTRSQLETATLVTLALATTPTKNKDPFLQRCIDGCNERHDDSGWTTPLPRLQEWPFSFVDRDIDLALQYTPTTRVSPLRAMEDELQSCTVPANDSLMEVENPHYHPTKARHPLVQAAYTLFLQRTSCTPKKRNAPPSQKQQDTNKVQPVVTPAAPLFGTGLSTPFHRPMTAKPPSLLQGNNDKQQLHRLQSECFAMSIAFQHALDMAHTHLASLEARIDRTTEQKVQALHQQLAERQEHVDMLEEARGHFIDESNQAIECVRLLQQFITETHNLPLPHHVYLDRIDDIELEE